MLSPPDAAQATPAAEADARLTELIGALQAISAKAPGPDMPDPDVVHELDPKQDRRYRYEWGLLAAARIARAALRASNRFPVTADGG